MSAVPIRLLSGPVHHPTDSLIIHGVHKISHLVMELTLVKVGATQVLPCDGNITQSTETVFSD